ncbi:MAG TPA: DHH family phosphoesterase, partial [Spirochaetota bacterium]|nr:DHH family phosphoesterase [Spirochaetota bacterium]
MEIKDVLKKYDKELTQIKKMIEKSSSIAIIGHINPDGDCIGSQLGLYSALKKIGKNVSVINEGVFKGIYKSNFQHLFISEIDKNYDLYIVLDTANKERIGNLYKKIDIEKTIVIDHHITNNNFGKANWVSDNFISASEMVFLLILKMEIDITHSDGIQYLLNGLLSDNGFFQHIRQQKSLSLLISHKMIEMGADSKKSYDLMFCNNSLDTIKLFSIALSRITPEMNG